VGIQIDLTAQEIAALKHATQLDDDAAAVARAAREFLRLKGLRELKAASGKVEFDDNWQELEERERGELHYPPNG
jgi:hypothetical protein